MPPTISDLLRRKDPTIYSVDRNSTVYDAIELMDAHRIGSVIVRSGSDVLGIFTERDYMRRIALQGRTSRTTLIGEVMTADLVSVGPETGIEQCMAIMTERRIRHLPVMQEGRIVGVVSIGDVVRHLSDEARAKAEHLEKMVRGTYPA